MDETRGQEPSTSDFGRPSSGPEATMPASGRDHAATSEPINSAAHDTVSTGRDGSERRTKLSIEVTPELNRVIERIATTTGATKSETVRKAIVLMDVAVEAKAQGERLFVGTVPPAGNSREIVGL